MSERVPAPGAAGGGARAGNSYVNGSSFNPKVLIALLNIYRVYDIWFQDRPCASTWRGRPENAPVSRSTTKARVPGTGRVVEIEKRRARTPVKRTPAMRLGIQEERHYPKTARLIMPNLHRIFYRPWILHGTSFREKFENPKSDLRRSRPIAASSRDAPTGQKGCEQALTSILVGSRPTSKKLIS